MQRLTALAVTLKDKKLGLQLGALFSLFSFDEVGMGFSIAHFVQRVCGEGVWRKRLDQGASALPFAPAVACLACLLLKEFLRAGLPHVRRHVQHCVIAPLALGEIPTITFEAVCKCYFPYAEPDLKPRWSIPCSVLETSLSPIPLPLSIYLMF